MTYDLKQQLRDLANCRHDDFTVGYEAADRIEELERQLNQPVVMSEWQTLVQERDQLREQVKMLRETVLSAKAMIAHPDNIAILDKALAATEPTAGGAS